MLRRVALITTNVSENRSTSIIRVTRIVEPGTTLAVASNDERCEEVLSQHKRQFLKGSHGVTSQKTAVYIVTAVKTLDLT
jgi:hypothetical protein